MLEASHFLNDVNTEYWEQGSEQLEVGEHGLSGMEERTGQSEYNVKHWQSGNAI